MNYGGHSVRPPAPADGGKASGNSWGGGNADVEKAAAGNPNAGQNMKDAIEAVEWAKAHSRGIEYGQTTGVGGWQLARIDAWKDRTGWDGDLNYPPPGFLEEEAERNHRLDAMKRQQQEIAWESGQHALWQMRHERAQANSSWAARAQYPTSGAFPPRPYGRR